jgi:hypothetical protein
MPWMVTNAEMLPHGSGDALQRSEIGGVTLGARTLQQERCQSVQLGVGQFREQSRAVRAAQALGTTSLPGLKPPAGALATDLQSPGDFGLRLSPREAAARRQPSRLFRRIIRATTRNPFHASDITRVRSCVTSFCEDQ